MSDKTRIQNHNLQVAPNDNNALHMRVTADNSDDESGLEDHNDQENIPRVVDMSRGGGGCHAGKKVSKGKQQNPTWFSFNCIISIIEIIR